MKIKLLTICLLLFSSQVFAKNLEYKKDIDEFNGRITETISVSQYYPKKNNDLAIKLFKQKEEVEWFSAGVGSIKTEDGYIEYFIAILTLSENWNIIGAKSGEVLLDGERWNNHKFLSYPGEVDSSSNKVKVYESHYFQYSYKDFIKITKAKIFKARVGNLIYSIDFSKVDFKKLNLYNMKTKLLTICLLLLSSQVYASNINKFNVCNDREKSEVIKKMCEVFVGKTLTIIDESKKNSDKEIGIIKGFVHKEKGSQLCLPEEVKKLGGKCDKNYVAHKTGLQILTKDIKYKKFYQLHPMQPEGYPESNLIVNITKENKIILGNEMRVLGEYVPKDNSEYFKESFKYKAEVKPPNKLTQKRFEKGTKGQKACVKTLGNGIYADYPLSKKMDFCNFEE